jgi:amidase
MVGDNRTDLSKPETAPRDYVSSLSMDSLQGVRIAVIRPDMTPAIAQLFEGALSALVKAGAIPVVATPPSLDGMNEAEFTYLKLEMKGDLEAYLASTATAITTRSLVQLIAFNRSMAGAEMAWFGQDVFEKVASSQGVADPLYAPARAKAIRIATDYLDGILKAAGADILIQPTFGPAWLIDPVRGDSYSGPSAFGPPAVAGYPHLTVPMGLVHGLPVGLSFIGRLYSEASLLSAGYAYEQASHARIPPTYRKTIAIDEH